LVDGGVGDFGGGVGASDGGMGVGGVVFGGCGRAGGVGHEAGYDGRKGCGLAAGCAVG